MDPYSILDKNGGEPAPAGDAVPANPSQPHGWTEGVAEHGEMPAEEVRFPGEDGGRSLSEMAQRDLTATLQLLAERAQYITGATGAAIALSSGDGMVCRASAGSSAPEVGAELQVNSGLSGESVRTRQTLRCDDAVTDERVNRESCEALGIRSVVVMPLLQGEQVIGVFELFSDKANVFEARDITALERMGSMVHAALEQSTAGAGSAAQASVETTDSAEEIAIPDLGEEIGQTGSGDIHLEERPPSQAEPTSVAGIASPDITEPVQRNGIEDLGATLDARAGIAFHKRVPAHTKASPAAEAAPAEAAAASAMTTEAEARPAESVAPAEAILAEETPTDSVHHEEPSEATAFAGMSEEVDVLEVPDVAFAKAEPDSPAEDVLETDLNPPATSLPATPPEATIETKVEVLSARPGPSEPATSEPAAPEPATAVRGAIANLRKCEACGFPVSEGRQLCLDCERKQKAEAPGKATGAAATTFSPAESIQPTVSEVSPSAIPNFLAGDEEEASWLATHKLMVVAVLLAVLVIVVLMVMR